MYGNLSYGVSEGRVPILPGNHEILGKKFYFFSQVKDKEFEKNASNQEKIKEF